MPEARDRLSRADEVTASYSRRRRSIGRSSGISILADEAEGRATGTPFRWGATAMTGSHGTTGEASASRGGNVRGTLGTPRFVRGRSLYGSPDTVAGRENRSPAARGRGRGRGRGSVLPSWYPRTPLQDITVVVRAMERRRGRLRGDEGLQLESPISQDQFALNPSVSTSGAQLEHDISIISPSPTIESRHCEASVGKVPKILLDITNQNSELSDCLTPQKKLLNSIDKVEKVVMEELRKLKRTPTAKKAERDKRVRTLMSMR